MKLRVPSAASALHEMSGKLPSRWSQTISWPSFLDHVTTYSDFSQTFRASSSESAATARAMVKRGGSACGWGGVESAHSAGIWDLLNGGLEWDRTRRVRRKCGGHQDSGAPVSLLEEVLELVIS